MRPHETTVDSLPGHGVIPAEDLGSSRFLDVQ
jgi:hypothetical protein